MPRKKTKTMSQELKKHDFRVTIFGSARLKKNDKIYKQVFNLAKEIGSHGFDVVTGGGPGLMEAANAGHAEGDIDEVADSIGLVIKLPWEAKGNDHLEIQKKFAKFSRRLDHFMALSNAFVIMPGGIGTTLELFYTLQLIQVRHMDPAPIIVVGKMWEALVKWIKDHPIKSKLASKSDLDNVYVAKNNKDAMKIILKEHKKYQNGHKKRKYKA